jgi:hypothetical protein
MAKHKFNISVNENGASVGAQCVHCGQIVLFENGRVLDDISAQECVREDSNQAAARVIREATEKV